MPSSPPVETTPEISDEDVVARLREHAAQFNHFCHVAFHRDIAVIVTYSDTPTGPPRIANIWTGRAIGASDSAGNRIQGGRGRAE